MKTIYVNKGSCFLGTLGFVQPSALQKRGLRRGWRGVVRGSYLSGNGVSVVELIKNEEIACGKSLSTKALVSLEP